jgi:AraC-like DNA-binding protein
VLYIEHIPAPPLSGFIRALWYARIPTADHRRERVLPSGCTEIILNLARDYLLDCPEGRSDLCLPPAIVVGARTVYEIIDSTDLADLIGIVFKPGGFSPFASDAADFFTNRFVSLEDVWGTAVRGLHDRLRETTTPQARLRCLEAFLIERFATRLEGCRSSHRSEVAYALECFQDRFQRAPAIATVRAMAGTIGRSERSFSQLFREEVGLSPKTWCRVQRFQRIVHQLHAGVDVPWAELALDCGYYDQAHFANEFRAFSGIDATTYSAARHTLWANHVPVD